MRFAFSLPLLAVAITCVSASSHADSSLAPRHHALEPRTSRHFGSSSSSFGGGSRNCPSSFKPDGSGTDGYSRDEHGNGVPRGWPSSWLYFGANVGWQPHSGYTVGETWNPPTAWVSTCSKASWWSPPSHWHHSKSFKVPSVWKKHGFHSWTWPAKSWSCSGSGSDGKAYDHKGNSCPSHLPSDWEWFGESHGWMPPQGWKCPSNGWKPPSEFVPKVPKCTWWAPQSSWNVPKEVKPPFFWPGLGWDCGCDDKPSTKTITVTVGGGTTSRAASTTKKATTTKKTSTVKATTTKKASSVTTKKPASSTSKSTVSHKPTTTKKASTSSKSTVKVTSTTKKVTTKATTTTKKPPAASSTRNVSSTSRIVTRTSSAARPTPTLPAPGWQCSGSGHDGSPVDHHGNSCPSHLPRDWEWYGTNYGWQPPAGWTCPLNDWTPPSSWIGSCGSATWWTPSSSWHYPSSLKPPSHWIKHGWHSYQWPSKSWTCDGSGKDGWDCDEAGNSCPSHLPEEFKFFGKTKGWQPSYSFSIPSRHWSPSKSWNPSHATWWVPKSTWEVPSGFSCPRSWKGHANLLGGVKWF